MSRSHLPSQIARFRPGNLNFNSSPVFHALQVASHQRRPGRHEMGFCDAHAFPGASARHGNSSRLQASLPADPKALTAGKTLHSEEKGRRFKFRHVAADHEIEVRARSSFRGSFPLSRRREFYEKQNANRDPSLGARPGTGRLRPLRGFIAIGSFASSAGESAGSAARSAGSATGLDRSPDHVHRSRFGILHFRLARRA
jgi:hypothetical protein